MSVQYNVLIVEDEPLFQNKFSDLAVKAGIVPTVVASLREARSQLKSIAFDLAIIDLSLDPMDRDNREGLEVMREIEKLGDYTQCVVISATAKLSEVRDIAPVTSDSKPAIFSKDNRSSAWLNWMSDHKNRAKASYSRFEDDIVIPMLRSGGSDRASSPAAYLEHAAKVMGADNGLRIARMLHSVAVNYLPIICGDHLVKNGLDESRKTIVFTSWSRRNGHAIFYAIARKDAWPASQCERKDMFSVEYGVEIGQSLGSEDYGAFIVESYYAPCTRSEYSGQSWPRVR